MLGLFSFTTFTFCWNTISWSADAYSFGVKINISRKTNFCVKTNFYFPLTRCFVRQGEFRLFQQEVSCFFLHSFFWEPALQLVVFQRKVTMMKKCRWFIAIDEIRREGLRLQPRRPTKQVSYAYACCLMRWWNYRRWHARLVSSICMWVFLEMLRTHIRVISSFQIPGQSSIKR